jgi:hypothetical protein
MIPPPIDDSAPAPDPQQLSLVGKKDRRVRGDLTRTEPIDRVTQ